MQNSESFGLHKKYVLNMLLDTGADIHEYNIERVTALYLCAQTGCCLSGLCLLQRKANASAISIDNSLPLHYSISNDTSTIPFLNVLLEETDDINSQNEKGKMAMHFVVVCAYPIVKTFIVHDVNLNILDLYNCTLLTYAFVKLCTTQSIKQKYICLTNM